MSSARVLLVEDEGIIAADIQDRLQSLGYEVPALAVSAEEALQKIPIHRPDLVLMDIMLQGNVDGIEAATKIRESHGIPVIFLTAHADESTVARAKLAEPLAYIIKPFEENELHTAVEISLHRHKMERERAKLLSDEHETHEKTIAGAIKLLTKLQANADPLSYEFSQRVKQNAVALGKALQVEEMWELETAAQLCRIGVISIPPILVQKNRSGITLSNAEKDLLNRIPELGRDILANFPKLQPIARLVYYHAKNFDGTGFPSDGIGGVNIPLVSRILKVVCDFLQIESQGLSKPKALEKMRGTPGAYETKILDHAMACLVHGGPRRGRAIPLKDLTVGDVLTEAIETPDGTLILNAGNKISPGMLRKLENFVQVSGIQEPIYVQ